MAGRPSKQGLDYFSFDTDMEQDKKIRILEATHKEFGWKVWTKILPRLYREHGYFFEANSESLLLFSKDIDVDINSITAVINTCIKLGLFDRHLYETFRILTSNTVQDRFLHVSKRRTGTYFIKDFLLLSEEELQECKPRVHFLIYDDINTIFDDFILKPDYKKYASRRISYTIVYKNNNNNNKGEGENDSGESHPQEHGHNNNGQLNGRGSDPSANPITNPDYPRDEPVDIRSRPKPMNWSWEIAYMLQDEQFIRANMTANNLTRPELLDWVDKFLEWLWRSGDQKPAERMKSHFANWYLKKQVYMAEQEEKIKKQTLSQSAGKEKPPGAYRDLKF